MPSPQLRSRLGYAAAVLTAAALFAHQLAPYLRADFAEDDAFISLRYAKRLVEGHGLTWTDGEWVEGYSNLLMVLGEAALGALGVDWFATLRVLGIGGTSICFAATVWYFRPGRAGAVLPGAFALLAFAVSAPLVICTATGFETPLILAFLGLALIALDASLAREGASSLRLAAVAGLPLGLAAITRPDGAIFSAMLGAGVLLAAPADGWRAQLGRVAALAVVPGLFVGGQLGFRLAYYGDWVPNTAHVKLPGGLTQAADGLVFLRDGLAHQHTIWLVALLALLPAAGLGPAWARRGARLLLPSLIGWLTYVVYTGGVWPMGRRFLVPALLVMVWLGGLGLASLGAWLRGRSVPGSVIPLFSLVLALGLGWVRVDQWRDPEINRAIHYDFHWKKKGELFADVFGRAFGARGEPYLAVDVAGAIPFYLEWPALDMLGLMDRWIATHPPADAAWTLNGHNLGDGAYVLSRQPDIVLFGVHFGTWGGVFTGGQQMHADPRFYEQYRYLELEREFPPSARIRTWLRLESDLVGLIRTDDRLEIPAWFFGKAEESLLLLADEIALPLAEGERAVATGIPVTAGRWAVRPRFTTGRLPFTVELAGAEGAAVEGSTLILPTDARLDLAVIPDPCPEGTRLAGVALERAPQPADHMGM